MNTIDTSTIACMTGFLVNMIDKSIQLISPCVMSEKWPLGYRIYGETIFTDTDDFRVQLNKIIEDLMPEKLDPDVIIKFHDLLVF